MKTKTIIQFVTLIIVFRPTFSQCQADDNRSLQTVNDSAMNNSIGQPDRFLWAEINAGYSNHGAAGSMTMNFRNRNFIFSAQYYKSHTCYKDDKERDHFLNDGHSEDHFTIESVAVLSGIFFRCKYSPILSGGVSCSKYQYVSTIHIEHNFTLSRILETITNSDYHGERLSSQTIYTIGIPLELKLHFAPKRFAGLDAGIKADLNLHSSFISAAIGIRLGRVISKHSNTNF